MPNRPITIKEHEVWKYAKRLHHNQVRKFTNTPYFDSHVNKVNGILKHYTKDEDILCASLLHDTIEDCFEDKKMGYEVIKHKFGEHIADLVWELTSDKAEMSKYESKGYYLANKMIHMSDDALTIKLADRLQNISDAFTASEKFRQKYFLETSMMIDIVEKHRSFTKIQSDILREIKFKLKNISGFFKLKRFREIDDTVNEELTPYQRAILYFPIALASRIIRSLFNICGMLNIMWYEVKLGTRKHEDGYIFHGSDQYMEWNIIKLDNKVLPKSLKYATFLRNWKVYLNTSRKADGRKIIYLSKDEIKTGDYCKMCRISDKNVYSKKDLDIIRNKEESVMKQYPMYVMVAKYDQEEEIKQIKQDIKDMCLDMTDEFPGELSIFVDMYLENINIILKLSKSCNNESATRLNELINELSERVKDYIKIEKGINIKRNTDLDNKKHFIQDRNIRIRFTR